MTLKKRLESVIRGWFPKEPKMPRDKVKMAETKVSKPKPWWWKPLWIGTILSTIAVSIVGYLIWNGPLVRAVAGLILTFLAIGFAYYIRVRPSMKINRAIYILIGITPIGFVLWVICTFILNRVIITSASGTWPLFLASGAVCFGLGALIGDWIGKRRNYILPLTP
jgi:hypothetical protein